MGGITLRQVREGFGHVEVVPGAGPGIREGEAPVHHGDRIRLTPWDGRVYRFDRRGIAH